MIVDLRDATAPACGGKAAALGRLLRAGMPVPPGFVVPSGAEALPDDVGARLAALGDPPVAVRSSAAGEDTATSSAAGQHDSFLGVRGAAAVGEAIRACRASLWSARARAYRSARGTTADPAMAVIVQRHVDADVAGVLFTGDPAVVEASWGLGGSVVGGLVTPDAWTVPSNGPARHTTGDKAIRVDRGPAGTVTSAVAAGDRRRPCLTDGDVRRLVAAGRAVAALTGAPADVEWALAGGELWLLQARPVTAPLPAAPPPGSAPPGHAPSSAPPGSPLPGHAPWSAPPGSPPAGHAPASSPVAALAGVPGGAGVATGPARLLTGPPDFARVRPGDVLVCRTTDPAWTPLFALAAAVVTETGGVLSHAAIVAREHGVPAVLAVAGALTALHDGETVVVDGNAGTVRPAR